MHTKIFLLLLFVKFLIGAESKIVGLVPVRNEALMIAPCLKALAMYADAIVVLDDASDDNTVDVVKALQQECRIEKIITKEKWYRDEPGDRNLLLQAGRAIGGTHFVVIDADEMFTANLLKNNLLRTKILALQPGEALNVTWINLWRSTAYYRYDYSVWSGQDVNVAFCDDDKCFYQPDNSQAGFIHTSRSPSNLKGKVHTLVLDDQSFDFLNTCLKDYGYPILRFNNDNINYDHNNLHLQRYLKDCLLNRKQTLTTAVVDLKVPVTMDLKQIFWINGSSLKSCYRHDFTAGLMHFQFVNWNNLLAKQAWYRCLEKIRNQQINVESINKMYGESKKEEDLRLVSCPKAWFVGYDFFDRKVYEQGNSWQKKQIVEWFTQYGKEFFADLDIWDVNWDV